MAPVNKGAVCVAAILGATLIVIGMVMWQNSVAQRNIEQSLLHSKLEKIKWTQPHDFVMPDDDVPASTEDLDRSKIIDATTTTTEEPSFDNANISNSHGKDAENKSDSREHTLNGSDDGDDDDDASSHHGEAGNGNHNGNNTDGDDDDGADDDKDDKSSASKDGDGGSDGQGEAPVLSERQQRRLDLQRANREVADKIKAPMLKTRPPRGHGRPRYPSPVQRDQYFPKTDLIANGIFPRLIGVGCQKCGTTSLYEYLRGVGGFLPSMQKEVHAWNGNQVYNQIRKWPERARTKSRNRLVWYSEKWRKYGIRMACNDDLVCKGNATADIIPFEITPRYIADLRRFHNIWEQFPGSDQLKFIFIVRDPTSRAWSSYFHVSTPEEATSERFSRLIDEEVDLLNTCYNKSLSFTFLEHAPAKVQKMSHLLLSSSSNSNRDRDNMEELAASSEGNKNQKGKRKGANSSSDGGYGDGDSDAFLDTLQTCKDVLAMYKEFHKCAKANAKDPRMPWFEKFTLQYDEDIDYAFKNFDLYFGLAFMGVYPDQLFNFLCAGFRPEQMLIITSSELRSEPLDVMKRITAFMEHEPFEITIKRLFRSGGVSNNSRSKGRMPAHTEEKLRRLFKPFNERFVQVVDRYNFHVNMDALLKEMKVDPSVLE